MTFADPNVKKTSASAILKLAIEFRTHSRTLSSARAILNFGRSFTTATPTPTPTGTDYIVIANAVAFLRYPCSPIVRDAALFSMI